MVLMVDFSVLGFELRGAVGGFHRHCGSARAVFGQCRTPWLPQSGAACGVNYMCLGQPYNTPSRGGRDLHLP